MTIQNPKWSKEPNKYLVKHLYDLKKGTVLDLGGSDGINVIFLAENDFEVTNVDNDVEALDKLHLYIKDNSLKINTLNADLNKYFIDKNYDNIISFYTFHFLDNSSGEKLLKNVQDKTNLGGLNILVGFTDHGEFRHYDTKFYFVGDFLLDAYKSWNILYHGRFIGPTKSGLNQEREVLVARKI